MFSIVVLILLRKLLSATMLLKCSELILTFFLQKHVYNVMNLKIILLRHSSLWSLLDLSRADRRINSRSLYIVLVTFTMDSDGAVTCRYKENGAKSIQSIGEILEDQGEFKRDMEVYVENTLNPLIRLGHDS